MPSRRRDERTGDRHIVRGFLLRIPEDLLSAARVRAKDDGITVTELILRAIRRYLDGR